MVSNDAIVAGAVLLIVFIVAILGVIFVLVCRSRRKKTDEEQAKEIFRIIKQSVTRDNLLMAQANRSQSGELGLMGESSSALLEKKRKKKKKRRRKRRKQRNASHESSAGSPSDVVLDVHDTESVASARPKKRVVRKTVIQEKYAEPAPQDADPHSSSDELSDEVNFGDEPEELNDFQVIFRDLGIDIEFAQPFIDEGLSVQDLPYIKEEELEMLLPNKKARKRLTALIEANFGTGGTGGTGGTVDSDAEGD